MRKPDRLVFSLLLGALLALVQANGRAEDDMEQGHELYRANCSPCHGENGDGKGPGSRLLPVKPTDHRDGGAMNPRSDEQLFDIIAKGGAGVGRSPLMPGWDGQLSPEQIRSLVAYIRSLATPPYERPRLRVLDSTPQVW